MKYRETDLGYTKNNKDLEETVITSHLYSLLFYVIPQQEYNIIKHPPITNDFLSCSMHGSNACTKITLIPKTKNISANKSYKVVKDFEYR